MILFQKVYKVSKRMLTFQIHFWNSIILDEGSGMNALFAERFTNIPSKVHNINAFKL